MGINLKDIVKAEAISLEDLKGKKVAIDSFNILYQFLSAIRDQKGNLFTDKKGRVTSHLMGLFYRTVNLLEAGAKPCFVFDGVPVDLKSGTSAMRNEIREAARQLYDEAIEAGEDELARKYAQQASKLTKEMIVEAKELIRLMGLPIVDAPHDGEAQAVWMCKEKYVDMVASQDWDCLLYGAPVFIRNLTASNATIQKVVLKDVLKDIGLRWEQLVEAAILIGTDFNTGVKGIGPKTAIKLAAEDKISEYSTQIKDFYEIKNIFIKPEVNKKFKLNWDKPDRAKLVSFLTERGFSKDRIDKTLERIIPKQKGLGEFI